ncbi:FKBP-type peptidyl-prolyl cis-trans isomerase [Postechiella marina]|uniref:peptidylprolyl isomerase n=1 Tax=Postechiella marina TaxID=943941 RepID=A0ABP8C8W9_9FLAO
MKIVKLSLLTLCLTIGLFSCKKDDDSDDVITIEVRDRDEVQEEDILEIETYLANHYYNSSELEAIGDPSSSDLEISALANGETEAPEGHTILWDLLSESNPILTKETKTYANTTYEFYVLKLNAGGGEESPNFSDEVRVNYEGFLLDDDATIFDSAVNPVVFDLTSLIPGWRKVLPLFNTAVSFEDGGDGTVDYMNHGAGVMFIPSGLAYFSNGSTGISTYTPIAFKFDLMNAYVTDHDGDGIPSYLEDLNGDGEFTIADPDDDTVTHDDTDGDFTPNYFDADDDADGIATINELEPKTYTVDTNNGGTEPVLVANREFEISRTEEAGVITINTVTIMDSNNDGVDDYLDGEITINYNSSN